MITHQYMRQNFSINLAVSLLIHGVALYFLLSLPIYGSWQYEAWYIVYLEAARIPPIADEAKPGIDSKPQKGTQVRKEPKRVIAPVVKVPKPAVKPAPQTPKPIAAEKSVPPVEASKRVTTEISATDDSGPVPGRPLVQERQKVPNLEAFKQLGERADALPENIPAKEADETPERARQRLDPDDAAAMRTRFASARSEILSRIRREVKTASTLEDMSADAGPLNYPLVPTEVPVSDARDDRLGHREEVPDSKEQVSISPVMSPVTADAPSPKSTAPAEEQPPVVHAVAKASPMEDAVTTVRLEGIMLLNKELHNAASPAPNIAPEQALAAALGRGGASTEIRSDTPAQEALLPTLDANEVLTEKKTSLAVLDIGESPADMFEETEGPVSLERELCMHCGMLSMLMDNPAEDIMYAQTAKEAPSIGGPDVYSWLCRFCEATSSSFTNPAGELLFAALIVQESQPLELLDVPGGGMLVVEVDTGPVYLTGEASPDEAFTSHRLHSLSASDAAGGSGIVIEQHISQAEAVTLVPREFRIMTPRSNRTPQPALYRERLEMLAALPVQDTTKDKPAAQEGLGIVPVLEPEIRIDVSVDGRGSSVQARLSRRPHPMATGSEDEETIEEASMEADDDGGTETLLRREFRVVKAEKGVYNFIVSNRGQSAVRLSVNFRLLLAGHDPRDKEYPDVELSGGQEINYLFIMPEGVFWDDEEYFSGEIEGPDNVTRFNDETGLVWKEKR